MAAKRLFLGLLDTSCPTVHLSPMDNKIGGLPDFYQSCPLSASPVCKLCSSVLYLLAQIYCPHEGSPYHRLLHIFYCTRLQCQCDNKSWVVLRSQEKEMTRVESKPPPKSAQGKWCADEDDWGTPLSEDQLCTDNSEGNEDNCDSTGQVLTLSSLSLDTTNNTTTGIGYNQKQAGYIPSYYVQVIEEPVEFHDSKKFAGKAVDSVDNCRTSSSEGYEKTTAKHGDKIFYKFHKRLTRCPEQVLRYQWNSTPLLITNKTLPAPLACQHCRAPRVFELQLMPPLVYLLKTSSGVDIEFGTVLVYTCSKSCWQVGSTAREEYIYVQPELEDPQLTKWFSS